MASMQKVMTQNFAFHSSLLLPTIALASQSLRQESANCLTELVEMSFDLQEPASSQEAGSKVAAPGFAPNQLHLVLHTFPKVTASGFAPN